jgi:methenyltetrahydromethanopterin cyclohydrolase
MNLNQTSWNILAKLADRDDVEIHEFEFLNGSEKRATVLDVGVINNSKLKDEENIGIKVAEASMGGLGKVKISEEKIHVEIPKDVEIATLSCQLAGWGININDKEALASGPARILAKKPIELIERVGYYEESEKGALILETEILPNKKVCEKILNGTKVNEIIIAAFKGNSKVNLINILARIVEVGVFRLHNLSYDIKRIKYSEGEVPIPTEFDETSEVIFKANDAIIYSSNVLFKVEGWDSELTNKMVSTSSSIYGKSFKEIFQKFEENFYKIPQEIFAPAKITIIDLKDGKEYAAGEIKEKKEVLIFKP